MERMSDQIKIPLADYPVMVSDKLELLDAVTIYSFKNQTETDGRWQAVCLCKSNFERNGVPDTAKSVRIYRWRWKRITVWNEEQRKRVPKDPPEYRWIQEQQTTINKPDLWAKIKVAVEKFLSEL